jgi:hypothetical protein
MFTAFISVGLSTVILLISNVFIPVLFSECYSGGGTDIVKHISATSVLRLLLSLIVQTYDPYERTGLFIVLNKFFFMRISFIFQSFLTSVCLFKLSINECKISYQF